jgi:hypothetical protein
VAVRLSVDEVDGPIEAACAKPAGRFEELDDPPLLSAGDPGQRIVNSETKSKIDPEGRIRASTGL